MSTPKLMYSWLVRVVGAVLIRELPVTIKLTRGEGSDVLGLPKQNESFIPAFISDRTLKAQLCVRAASCFRTSGRLGFL